MEARIAQAVRQKNIIEGAARCAGLSVKDLAKKTGIRYETLLRHLNYGTVSTEELATIGQILGFDMATYAACCGMKERCRFEKGGAV